MAQTTYRSQRLDPDTTFRKTNALDKEVLNKMWKAMLAGTRYPPIILCRVDDKYRLVQGHYTLALAMASGNKNIHAIFVQKMY